VEKKLKNQGKMKLLGAFLAAFERFLSAVISQV
jgi:hypothetical protein